MAILLRITKEWELNFFPGPFTHPNQQKITPKPGWTTLQAFGTCVHHPHHSYTWIQGHRVYTSSKEEGRGQQPPEAVSRLDTGSTACAVLWMLLNQGEEGVSMPGSLFLLVFTSSVPLHPWGKGKWFLPEARPASQPAIWKAWEWSWPWFSACVFNTLRLIFSLAPLGPGFYSGISEKCSQGDLECKDSSYFKDSGNNSPNHQHWSLLNKAPRHKCHLVHSHLFSMYCMPGSLLEARVIE